MLEKLHFIRIAKNLAYSWFCHAQLKIKIYV